MSWTLDTSAYRGRTGLATNPGSGVDFVVGWRINAAVGDLVGDSRIQDVVVVTAQSPIGFVGDVKLDVACNSTATGFAQLCAGGEILAADQAGVGDDVSLDLDMYDLGGGHYSSFDPSSGASVVYSRYYFDTAARAAARGHTGSSEGSLALGQWPKLGPISYDTPDYSTYELYEAPYVRSRDHYVGAFFQLDAEIRIPASEPTYPNYADSKVAAIARFSVGDPRAESLGSYLDGRRNVSAVATARGFARW